MSRLVGRGMLVTWHCAVRGTSVGDGVLLVFVCHVEQDSSRSVAIAEDTPVGIPYQPPPPSPLPRPPSHLPAGRLVALAALAATVAGPVLLLSPPPPSPGRGGERAVLLLALAICGAHCRRGGGGRCGCWQSGSVARRVGVVVRQRCTGGGGEAVVADPFLSLSGPLVRTPFFDTGISSRHRQSRMGVGCGS